MFSEAQGEARICLHKIFLKNLKYATMKDSLQFFDLKLMEANEKA